jgi:hypothetical protein
LIGDRDSKSEAFVWRSTDASVESGVLSLLACVEVAIAIALYWSVAVWLDTQAHLWFSILVAPLLLLRSPQSTELGVRWFEHYVHHGFGRETHSYSYALAIASIASVATVVLSTFLLSRHWVPNQSLPMAVSLSLIIGYISAQAGVASALSIAANDIASLLSAKWFLAVIATSMVGSSIVGVTAAGIDIISASIIVTTTVLLSVAGLLEAYKFAAAAARVRGVTHGESRGVVAAKAVLITAPGTFLTFAPGVFVAGWLRSVGIRFTATVRHLLRGFFELPSNWWRTIFVVDFIRPPEVVPGYSREDLLQPRYLFTEIKNAKGARDLLAYLMALVIMFAPAYVYRITIKSTSWFYAPIIYLVSPRSRSLKPLLFSDLVWASPMEWARRLLAVATLTIFAANQAIFIYLKGHLPAEIISPIEYVFLLDTSAIKPWQWFNILSAVLTTLIFVWVGTYRIIVKHNRRDPSLADSVRWRGLLIEYTMRMRNLSTALLLCITFVHVLFWKAPYYLPSHVLRFVHDFFGWS